MEEIEPVIEEVAESASYALTQADVDSLFTLLISLDVILIFIFVILVIIGGLIFGSIVTKRWHV